MYEQANPVRCPKCFRMTHWITYEPEAKPTTFFGFTFGGHPERVRLTCRFCISDWVLPIGTAHAVPAKWTNKYRPPGTLPFEHRPWRPDPPDRPWRRE